MSEPGLLPATHHSSGGGGSTLEAADKNRGLTWHPALARGGQRHIPPGPLPAGHRGQCGGEVRLAG